MENMIANRVERHIINNKNPYYTLLDQFCLMSKNLYNYANYHIRKQFIEHNTWLRYCEIDKFLKQKDMDFDYRSMPTAQSAQQCLRLLEKNWKSFFVAIKDWSKNKDKYTGRPKLPKYLSKNGRNILILTNNNCRLKNNIIKFPKVFNGFILKTKIKEGFQQVRIIPKNKHFIIEVVYRLEIPEVKSDNKRYYSIDIGLDNFATITNNFGEKPTVINGKGLKSINKYYNKKVGHCREIAKRMNNLDYTKKMKMLTAKRNNKVSDFIHKASKLIVDLAFNNNVSIIIIGNNKNWKHNSRLSKKVNQSFVGIPHQEFINKIIYKAEDVGIKVILTEESYTSGTSFLDGESPIKENYNKSRRKSRGLFISDKGLKINADVNGAYQIMKKVFPNAFSNGIEGVGLHPIVVNVA